MSQYQNNLGRFAELSPNNKVTNHYGKIGAEATWLEVLDSSKGNCADPDNSQLRIYNIMTWLGGYTLPIEGAARLAILGHIQYGIGGAIFDADFDWKIGTQMSIAASFVRVSAAYSEIFNTAPVVSVGAMLSSGSRASRAQVTRSYPQLVINNDVEEGTKIFPIPPLAHALNLFSREPDFYEVGAAQIRFISGANNGFNLPSNDLCSFAYDAAPFLVALANEDGVRFPESAKFVEISTTETGVDYHVTPCFTLSL